MDNYWKNQHVLVTGAGGFIGSHLVETLVNQGAQVSAFVRYNSRRDPGLIKLLPEQTYRQLDIIFGDLRDASAVQAAMSGKSHVFHLGASISIPYSYLHPVEVVESNVMGTLNVLMAARSASITRLVHTSSSEVYGTAQRVPIRESHRLRGQSPYSASKIGADKLVESFQLTYDLPVVTLRPFNTYGPRQSTRAVIPTIITQALAQDAVCLGNMEARRDFTFIHDVVRGFVLAAQIPNVEGETFNLGTGLEIRMADLAKQIIEMIGRQIPVIKDAERLRPEHSEVQRLVSDYQHARDRLGWEPQTELEQGLSETIAWIRQNLDLYRPGIYQV